MSEALLTQQVAASSGDQLHLASATGVSVSSVTFSALVAYPSSYYGWLNCPRHNSASAYKQISNMAVVSFSNVSNNMVTVHAMNSQSVSVSTSVWSDAVNITATDTSFSAVDKSGYTSREWVVKDDFKYFMLYWS